MQCIDCKNTKATWIVIKRTETCGYKLYNVDDDEEIDIDTEETLSEHAQDGDYYCHDCYMATWSY